MNDSREFRNPRKGAGFRRRSVAALLVVGALAILALASSSPSPARQPDDRSGRTSFSTDAPVAPAPPRRYAVPRVRYYAASAAQLRRLLSSVAHQTIVLADGAYRSSTPFVDNGGDRIYAEHLGRAVLKAGLVLGAQKGAAGPLVQGVSFDIANPTLTDENAAIDVWGSATGATIRDVAIDGHRMLGSGILARQTTGLRIQRVVAHGFTSYGVYADAYPSYGPLRRPMLLTDLDASDVSRPVPRSANGTAEACVWVGSRAVVRRVRAAGCAWMGLWTGTGTSNSLFESVHVDRTPVGIYAEHYTHGSTFRRFSIGPEVTTGVVCEWDNPKTGGKPACVGDAFQDGTIDSTKTGVYLDEGTTRTTVSRVRFLHQARAAIIDYRGVGNVFTGNDFSGIGAGAAQVSHDAN